MVCSLGCMVYGVLHLEDKGAAAAKHAHVHILAPRRVELGAVGAELPQHHRLQRCLRAQVFVFGVFWGFVGSEVWGLGFRSLGFRSLGFGLFWA